MPADLEAIPLRLTWIGTELVLATNIAAAKGQRVNKAIHFGGVTLLRWTGGELMRVMT